MLIDIEAGQGGGGGRTGGWWASRVAGLVAYVNWRGS